MARPLLVIFVTAVAAREGRLVHLDDKFVEGMALYCREWDGPVRVVMPEAPAPPPFSHARDPTALGFDLVLMPPTTPPEALLPPEAGMVLGSADSAAQLGLADLCRARGVPLVFGVEYTLGTRLRIARMDPARNAARRLWSAGWNLRQEPRRRAALSRADGVQMNGFPAAAAYAGLNRQSLLYLDNRMTAAMMATPAEMAARAARHARRAPLRLIHSGRLEPMKGAHLIAPLVAALDAVGLTYRLDIYGEGSVRPRLTAALAALGHRAGGKEHVRLHRPLPFADGLVPVSRREADLFVSLHTQSDPSCSYIEAMGCGLPVAGFDNRMLTPLIAQSGGGWTVPMRDVRALAARIRALDGDRTAVMRAAETGLAFAARHDFEREFTARTDQLKAICDAATARRGGRGPAGS